MKTSEYLKAAASALEGRSYAGKGPFQLTYALGQVLCRRRSLCVQTLPNFGRFTDLQLLEGLSSKQWESIFTRMFKYFELHQTPRLTASQLKKAEQNLIS